MTTAPAPASSPERARPRRPTLHTARWLLRQHLKLVVWATAILVVACTVALVLIDRYGQIEISVVQFGRQGFTWFPFSIAIATITAYLSVHVAAGMTRRALGRATLLVAVVVAAVYTVIMTLALQLERAVYGTRTWAQQITDELPVFDDTSQVGWILTDLMLLFTAAQLCGLLVGLVYYRVGGWWGTLALPLTAGPVLLITPLLTTELLDPMSAAARVPIAIGLLVAVAVAYLTILRRVPIRAVST